MIGLLKWLIDRLRFGRESPRELFNHLTLSQLYDIHRDALPESPTKARTRAELSNREAPLKEWVAIYKRSLNDVWAEGLSLRKIRQARATDEEWHQVFTNSPKDSRLYRIARKKMKYTSRS